MFKIVAFAIASVVCSVLAITLGYDDGYGDKRKAKIIYILAIFFISGVLVGVLYVVGEF